MPASLHLSMTKKLDRPPQKHAGYPLQPRLLPGAGSMAAATAMVRAADQLCVLSASRLQPGLASHRQPHSEAQLGHVGRCAPPGPVTGHSARQCSSTWTWAQTGPHQAEQVAPEEELPRLAQRGAAVRARRHSSHPLAAQVQVLLQVPSPGRAQLLLPIRTQEPAPSSS